MFSLEFAFRQDSFFYYLTGWEEPGAHLIIDLRTQTATMFLPDEDPGDAVWHGPAKYSNEMATLAFSVKNCMYVSQINNFLESRIVLLFMFLKEMIYLHLNTFRNLLLMNT